TITIDGGTGSVIIGAVDLVPPQLNEDFETVLGWADDIRRLQVWANADTPEDAARAREFGAQGIGLCRTEHMFMAEERLPVVRAIIRAAVAVRERTGRTPLVEIMHPLVGFAEELKRLRALTLAAAADEAEIDFRVGTMIELPRACVRADEIAEFADFFSFGTNDLTQTALGFSRDDAEGKFLTYYLEHGVLERNPFETLDVSGVGDLMRVAVERGLSVRGDLHLGICGEHGGEPTSVAFCHELGLDYVS